jgi:hypothetical protein
MCYKILKLSELKKEIEIFIDQSLTIFSAPIVLSYDS